MYDQKRILITGGAGNIGASLARALVRYPQYQVVVVDNLSTGTINKLPDAVSNFQFIEADVNQYEDIAAIMQTHRFTHVFHYAAVVGVARTLANPVRVLHDIEGIKNIFELSKTYNVERIFYASSSEVYGEPVSIPQHEETTPLNSRLPYAVVKNVGEVYCKAYQRDYGVPFTIFRFFNTYGPFQSDDFVLPRFLKAAQQNQPINIYGDGLQTRTFCYIDDNVAATIAALHQQDTINQTINIGSNEEVTILDLAKMIVAICQSDSDIIHLPALSEGDMTRRFPDISRMQSILGRSPLSLETGIRKMLAALNKA